MKTPIILACACLSVFAVAAFAQQPVCNGVSFTPTIAPTRTISSTQHYFGTITAVNTGYYNEANDIFCAVQVDISGTGAENIRSDDGFYIVLVSNGNPLRREILETLLSAQASNTPVHLRTTYRSLCTNWNHRFSELHEASFGEQPWPEWP